MIGVGLDLGAVRGGARIARAVPSGLPTLPILPIQVNAPGNVVVDRNAADACRATLSAEYNAGTYYVKPSTGSNANNGTSTSTPFQTLSYAVRTAAAGSNIICLEAFETEPFDIRATDASQTSARQVKHIFSDYPITIRTAGPDLTAATWTQNGTYADVWQTTFAGFAASANVTRVLLTNLIDAWGNYTQLAKQTSIANTSAAASGWYFDTATDTLYVKIAGGGSVEAAKANLKGQYLGSAGTSRMLIYGAPICFEGPFTFEGVQMVLLELSSRRPEIWMHGCTVKWAYAKGFDATGGRIVLSECEVYSSETDNANGFTFGPATGVGLILDANCYFADAGTPAILVDSGSLQGLSAHGGFDHVSYGSIYDGNNGQGVADTCANSQNDVSWLVGTKALAAGNVTKKGYEFGSAATSASRAVWLDTCSSEGNATDLTVGSNATVKVYNCTLPVVSGSTTAYAPDSP